MLGSRLKAVAAAAVLALAAAAFAPAPSTVEPITGPIALDDGLVIEVDASMRVPVTLGAAAVIDVRPDGTNAESITEGVDAGTTGVFGFAVVQPDAREVAASAVSSPLRTDGVENEPAVFGTGREAGSTAGEVEEQLDDACGRCVLEPGSYELIIVATNGPATVHVNVEGAEEPVEVDRETARVSFAPWQVFHSSRDSADAAGGSVAGPSAGYVWMSTSIVCSGCMFPDMLVVHDGLATVGDATLSVGAVQQCTGEAPVADTDCQRRPVTSPAVAGDAALRQTIVTSPTNRVVAELRIDGAGADQRLRLRQGRVVILLPDTGGHDADAQELDIQVVSRATP